MQEKKEQKQPSEIFAQYNQALKNIDEFLQLDFWDVNEGAKNIIVTMLTETIALAKKLHFLDRYCFHRLVIFYIAPLLQKILGIYPDNPEVNDLINKFVDEILYPEDRLLNKHTFEKEIDAALILLAAIYDVGKKNEISKMLLDKIAFVDRAKEVITISPATFSQYAQMILSKNNTEQVQEYIIGLFFRNYIYKLIDEISSNGKLSATKSQKALGKREESSPFIALNQMQVVENYGEGGIVPDLNPKDEEIAGMVTLNFISSRGEHVILSEVCHYIHDVFCLIKNYKDFLPENINAFAAHISKAIELIITSVASEIVRNNIDIRHLGEIVGLINQMCTELADRKILSNNGMVTFVSKVKMFILVFNIVYVNYMDLHSENLKAYIDMVASLVASNLFCFTSEDYTSALKAIFPQSNSISIDFFISLIRNIPVDLRSENLKLQVGLIMSDYVSENKYISGYINKISELAVAIQFLCVFLKIEGVLNEYNQSIKKTLIVLVGEICNRILPLQFPGKNTNEVVRSIIMKLSHPKPTEMLPEIIQLLKTFLENTKPGKFSSAFTFTEKSAQELKNQKQQCAQLNEFIQLLEQLDAGTNHQPNAAQNPTPQSSSS